MMRFFPIIILALVGCISPNLMAQQELYLANDLTNCHANTAINPALWPKDKKFFVGLPAIGLEAWHSGKIRYNDFIHDTNGTTTINLDDLIGKLEARNTFNIQNRIETISLGWKIGKFHVMGHHAIKSSAQLSYNKEMAQLLWQGNAQFIGQTIQIDPKFEFSTWNEWALGAAYQTSKFTFSARGKHYSGVQLVKSKQFSASIYTNPDIYQLELQSDIAIIASDVLQSIDTTERGYHISTGDLNPGKLFSSNNGFGLDLGVVYDNGHGLSVGMSVLDLGAQITWKNQLHTFESNGNYTYNGQFFNGNSFLDNQNDIHIDQYLDSIQNIFAFAKSATTFKQTIPTRFNAHANYALNPKIDIGAAFTTIKTVDTQWGLGASLTWKPKKWLRLGTQLSTNDHAPVQLGALVHLKLGPLGMYLVSDNGLSAFLPASIPNVHFRYGMQLAF